MLHFENHPARSTRLARPGVEQHYLIDQQLDIPAIPRLHKKEKIIHQMPGRGARPRLISYNATMTPAPADILLQLKDLQQRIRSAIIASRGQQNLHAVNRTETCDTIYELDVVVEPILIEFFEEWSRTVPLIVIAEGLEPETGRVFPAGIDEDEAALRILLDPIDGTRGLMYDKRSAWSLAAAAPNRGPNTRLSDAGVSVMTELPTSKLGRADVLWAIRGQGAHGVRESLGAAPSTPLLIAPSTADTLDHGFATVADFFPGTKVLAGQVMEHLVRKLIGPAQVGRATVFEDQYISTGGQLYELIVGHDRFIADLRPLFYRIQKQEPGLCVHPYDLAAALIAEEAGVILTDGLGMALDAPFDLDSNHAWAGYANARLRDRIQPLLSAFLHERLLEG